MEKSIWLFVTAGNEGATYLISEIQTDAEGTVQTQFTNNMETMRKVPPGDGANVKPSDIPSLIQQFSHQTSRYFQDEFEFML